MRRLWVWCGALLLVGCASAPHPRMIGSTPQNRVDPVFEYPVPTPSWPLRIGMAVPPAPVLFTPPAAWPRPELVQEPTPVAVVPIHPAVATATLPLPEVLPLPVRQTPASRSWTVVTQARQTVLPIPVLTAPTPAPLAPPKPLPKTEAKTDAKTEKAPVTVPIQARPTAKPVAPQPPSPAASASLLPVEKPVASDFHWEDVNAVAGDAVTLHFDKTNWLYLDTPGQQKTLGFQSINRDKDATTFQFRPMVPGSYTLEFQRQDLVNQSTDLRKVKLTVVPAGTRTSSTGTALNPQTSTTSANDALEASRLLAASGKTSEAVQRLLQSYKADDARVNLELARLLNQSGQDSEALSYLDKNLTLPGPDFQGTLELGTRLAASKDPQKRLPAYLKMWTAGTSAPPEDLFLDAFEALRSQKLTAQAKDWSARYAAWFPAPKLKDRYLYQLGLFLEEPGDTRDVRGAWKAYNEVVEAYPLSPYWKAAGERAAYLNRHFLQVR